jgi:hypothetical protein
MKAEEKNIFEEIKPIDPKFKLEIEDIGQLHTTLTKDSRVNY